MRKLVVLVLASALCLAALSFAACGNTSKLEERIAELERQLEEGGVKGEKGDKGDKGDTGAIGSTGPQGPAGIAVTNKIYSIGDEVTISDNGYDLFKIKVNSVAPSGGSFLMSFTVTNINMPNQAGANYIRIVVDNSRVISFPNSINIYQGNPETFNRLIGSSIPERIAFGFPIGDEGIILYAIFQT